MNGASLASHRTMSRKSPRYVPPGSMVELTARTVGARFLLRPTPALTERILGTLGRALSRLPVDLHAFAFLSNHWHSLVTAPDALTVSRFLQHVHSTVAVAVNELHGWDGKVFGKASQIVVATDSEERRLRYVLAQGAKEGLVASPLDWPGAHSARALCGLEELRGVWLDRSREARIRAGGGNGGGREPRSLGVHDRWESFIVASAPAGALQERRRSRRSRFLRSCQYQASPDPRVDGSLLDARAGQALGA